MLQIGTTSAVAHEGQPLGPHDLWGAWSWEPVTLMGLASSAVLYVRGVYRLWQGAGFGRGVRCWQALAFAGGWLTLGLALVSPLHTLGPVLFFVHMIQHEVLMLIAAPLFVLSRPLLPFLWGLPRTWQQRVARWGRGRIIQASWQTLTDPLVIWIVHALAVWLWHIPGLYQATLDDETVHILQHVSFLGTALLFWWALIYGRHGKLGYGLAVLYVFTTAVHTSILGALLTFAPSLWYPAYAETTAAWRLTPLEDQQLGGLIMWVPGGVVYVFAGLAFFVLWLEEVERRVLQREGQRAVRTALERG